MSFEAWLAFVLASAVLTAIPGPTVMLVVGFGLGEGRRGALAAAPGVALGDLVAMSASMAGVGAVLAASATLFSAVKLAGAAYLLWLGWRMWRSARDAGAAPEAVARRSPRGAGRMFREAFLVTLLNPKSLMFFIAFAPQFMSSAAPFVPQAALLVGTFTAIGFLNALAWGLAAGGLRARLTRPRTLAWVARVGGGCLMGAGAATALTARV